jgi:hypothetical protein
MLMSVAVAMAVGLAPMTPAQGAHQVSRASQQDVLNPDRQVGIWFSAWYRKSPHWLWIRGHGSGSSKQFVADVNGDGKADSVVYFAASGSWYAAMSNGDGFGGWWLWASGHGVGSTNQMLEDVNGDGRADAVAYFAGSGSWYAALSHGAGFGGWALWTSGHGVGSTNQMLADVNGDRRAEAIVYFAASGSWYAALSHGAGFGGWALWTSGHGVGSTKQMLADVNGDGRADAVVYFAAPGSWYAAMSHGAGFGGWWAWVSGHGVGSASQMLGDVNGDRRADAIVYFPAWTNWYVGLSDGARFLPYQLWKTGHGSGAWADAKDLTGDGAVDAVTYAAGDASWRVVPAGISRVAPGETMSTWDVWGMRYRPIINGVPEQYDSGDPATITYQMNQIQNAGIDFLVFDMTNNVRHYWIRDRALAICRQINRLRASGLRLKYAIAVGNIQFSGNANDPEIEAGFVLEDYVNNADCGGADTYYHLDGKPLLVVYANWPDRLKWQQLPTHPVTSRFTVRYGQGTTPDATSYPSRSPNGGCGTVPASTTPPASEYGRYYGWGMPYGALPLNGGDTMTVMAGWNNHRGQFVSRTQYNSPGGFYTACGWDRVLAANPKPRTVIINSYNEFAEETAIEPADTSTVTAGTEAWPSPNYYWNLTVQRIAAYKSS